MSSTSGPSVEHDFTELVETIEDIAYLVDHVVSRLLEMEQIPEDLRETLEAVPEIFSEGVGVVVEEVASGEFDDSLYAHQLDNNHPAWSFKRAVYEEALARYRDEDDEWGDDGEPSDKRPRWYKRWAQKIRHPMAGANVILRSVAASVPAGGAINELKDGVEATVDFLAS
jgi:hypothetical protein